MLSLNTNSSEIRQQLPGPEQDFMHSLPAIPHRCFAGIMTLKRLLLSFVVMIVLGASPLSAASKNRIKMNFNDVEVITFIKIIGKETGRTFIFNGKDLKGKKVTLISDQRFSSSEAFKIFESVLDINGLATIQEGKVTRIISSKEAKTESTPLFFPHGL